MTKKLLERGLNLAPDFKIHKTLIKEEFLKLGSKYYLVNDGGDYICLELYEIKSGNITSYYDKFFYEISTSNSYKVIKTISNEQHELFSQKQKDIKVLEIKICQLNEELSYAENDLKDLISAICDK